MILKNKKYNSFFAKCLTNFNDKLFCQITFYLRHQYLPDLKRSKLFNEKLLNLKLNKKEPIYKKIVNKVLVKEYVSSIVGEEYLIPTLGVYTKFDEIDFNVLPNRFAYKISNGSQNNLIIKDKTSLNLDELKRKTEEWINFDYYKRTREWPYKDQENEILIEKFISDSKGKLVDYKFWCFNGQPKFVQLDLDRFENHKRDFYDIDFEKKMNFQITYPNSTTKLLPPKNYSKMVELAKILSKGFEFIRIDFYNVDGVIYFGEMTLYPGNCNEPISPFQYEKILGDFFEL